MQRLISTSIILGLFIFGIVHAQELPDYITENSTLFILQVDGLEEVKGEVRIAVFNSKESYTKEPVYAVVLGVEDIGIEWAVPDLPFGEYAIAVYHDKNKNGKLDTNLLGIPKEEYGFSNNARGRFGPASWEEAKFSIQAKSAIHKIDIK